MTSPKRYDRIAFVASAGAEAQQARAQLVELYGNRDPADADIVVALGGDGLMLQTLHQHMRSDKPIYGMHRGTVGFLMNEFSPRDLHDRLAAAKESVIHPLLMRATDVHGVVHLHHAINEVALFRQTHQAARLRILIDERERMAELRADASTRRHILRTIGQLETIAEAAYRTTFPVTSAVSERVLWPHAEVEEFGMEDARFVQFTDDDGSSTYYATYTAFDGANIAQHLLQTDDFLRFDVSPIAGPGAVGKGLALFPRKVGGRFMALSRSDRENNSLTVSDDLRCWPAGEPIQSPTRSWELLQLGNCGSPIETSDGWLVLTHGVGPMRTYALGAILYELLTGVLESINGIASGLKNTG